MNTSIAMGSRKDFLDIMNDIFEKQESKKSECDPNKLVSIDQAIDNAKQFFYKMTGIEKFEVKAASLFDDTFRMAFNYQRLDGSIANWNINIDAKSGKPTGFHSC